MAKVWLGERFHMDSEGIWYLNVSTCSTNLASTSAIDVYVY